MNNSSKKWKRDRKDDLSGSEFHLSVLCLAISQKEGSSSTSGAVPAAVVKYPQSIGGTSGRVAQGASLDEMPALRGRAVRGAGGASQGSAYQWRTGETEW